MSRLHPVRGENVVKALQKIGFVPERQKGSHVFMKHSDGRATVISVHKGEELGPGILVKIMQDIKLTRKEFLELLGKHHELRSQPKYENGCHRSLRVPTGGEASGWGGTKQSPLLDERLALTS